MTAAIVPATSAMATAAMSEKATNSTSSTNTESYIAKWFAGQVLFITGATGFMGKVLVEKLIRDCPDIKECYLLMRAKRGIEPEHRRDDYINHMVRQSKSNSTRLHSPWAPTGLKFHHFAHFFVRFSIESAPPTQSNSIKSK